MKKKNHYDNIKEELLKEYNIFLFDEDRKKYERELSCFIKNKKYDINYIKESFHLENKNIKLKVIPNITNNFKITFYSEINNNNKIKSIKYDKNKESFKIIINDEFDNILNIEYIPFSYFDFKNLKNKLIFYIKTENTKDILEFTHKFSMSYINKKFHI